MATRNITFNLPTELIRQVKIYAAEHDTTVNALVRDLLQNAMSQESRTREAAARLLALPEEGLRFSANLQSSHEDLHERR